MVLRQLERVLGRGQQAHTIEMIEMSRIDPNPYQTRRQFAERELSDLAQSIENYGVIQPIVVRPVGKRYQIVAGERRFRACVLLGHRVIPVLVKEMNDEKAATISLIDNLQKRELNYLEEANAYRRLIDDFGITQEELAKRIGKSQSAIGNKLRLLKLPEPVQELISPEIISERHAGSLLKLTSPEMQMEVLRQIYERGLSVKETEALVEELSQNNIPRESTGRESGQNVSLIIKDVRIFVNTIKETVKRARQTGVDISITERSSDDEYELVIKVRQPKRTALLTMPH
ncbi:MAG: ParB/RepB/Spo0J family partition protein [Syntrophomonadaceae bacterium]|jgi:ParB family chromosome partitioning protein|nr:ParB/RepB/Spo0J family partition protein [Syntrophomonadaceae bacterium]